jgi:phage/plasmid-associated DNA primase
MACWSSLAVEVSIADETVSSSAVLDCLLDGLRDWMENGLIEPKAVVEATARYRSVI